MKKKIHLPLSVHVCPELEICQKLDLNIHSKRSGFEIVQSRARSVALLLVASDSPLRILLIPQMNRVEHKTAKSCCDKGCGSCKTPLRTSSIMGHFVARRLNKALKKGGVSSLFHWWRYEEALWCCCLAPYPCPEPFKRLESSVVDGG
ncbi:MAG: hypothetical protein ACFCUX_08680 [Candidatus Methylacidiphilales bacterium]